MFTKVFLVPCKLIWPTKTYAMRHLGLDILPNYRSHSGLSAHPDAAYLPEQVDMIVEKLWDFDIADSREAIKILFKLSFMSLSLCTGERHSTMIAFRQSLSCAVTM